MAKFQGSPKARNLHAIALKARRKAERTPTSYPKANPHMSPENEASRYRGYLSKIGQEERAAQPIEREPGRLGLGGIRQHEIYTKENLGRTLAEKMRARREPKPEREMPGRKVSFTPREPGAPVEDAIAQSAKQGFYGPGNREGIQEMMYHRENPYGEFPNRAMLAEKGVADTDNPYKEVPPEDAAKAGKSFLKHEVKDPQQAGEVEEFIKQNPEIMKQFLWDNYMSKPGVTGKGGENTGLSQPRAKSVDAGSGPVGMDAAGDEALPIESELAGSEASARMHAAIPGPAEALERRQGAFPLVRKASMGDAPPDLMARKMRAVTEMMARRDADIERNKAATPTTPSITRSLTKRPTGVAAGQKKYVKPGVFRGEVTAIPDEEAYEIAGASKPNPERRKYTKSMKKVKKGPRSEDVGRIGGDATDYREGWQRLAAALRKRRQTPHVRREGPLGVD